MRLLADENLPRTLVEALGRDGHDVRWVREETPGISDIEVVALAVDEGRTIISFDKDFGDLAMRAGLAAPGGLLLLRFVPEADDDPMVPIRRAMQRIGHDARGKIVVIEPRRVRIRLVRPGRSRE